MVTDGNSALVVEFPFFLIYETDLCKKLIDVDSMAMFFDHAVGYG